MQLRNFDHVRERDKALLRSIMVGGVWNGMVSCWAEFGVRRFLVGSVVLLMVMVTCFGNVPFLLLVRFVKILSFMISLEWTRLVGQDACSGMASPPILSGVIGASPWAADASESAGYLVEVALGLYSSGLVAVWSPPDEFDEAEAAACMPDHPNVWTDGSLVLYQVAGISSSGSGFFAHQSENCWSGRRWGHVDGVRPDDGFCLVVVFAPSLGLFGRSRAEMWGVTLAL